MTLLSKGILGHFTRPDGVADAIAKMSGMEDDNLPSRVVSMAIAEHYRWGGNGSPQCDGWHLLRTPDLHVMEERMPPSAKETRHFHIEARQFFYILEGELTIEIDHRDFTLHSGQGIEVAPGQLHQVFNHGPSDLRLLVISQPTSHGDRTESP